MESKDQAPQPLQLSKAQGDGLRSRLRKLGPHAFLEQITEYEVGRPGRVEFFQRDFPMRLRDLGEADLLELLARLWAAQLWGNKQYLVQKIVSANGLEKVREELARLWDTALPVADRYERFIDRVSHLGPAAVTEIMCYVEPHRCGIWNQKTRSALRILGLDCFVSPEKYRISGSEYETFNRLLAAIAKEIIELGLKQKTDLLTVDHFLCEVAREEPTPGQPSPPIISVEHDEVRDMIQQIGVMLGFDTDVEFTVAHGTRVDVVWRARIGNLGAVTYVFEVQKGGSVDSLILNLQKAKNSPTVQKVIAVSDDDQLQKIEKETEGLQAEFRKALAFWKISEVQQVSQNLQAATEIINKLGLVPGKS